MPTQLTIETRLNALKAAVEKSKGELAVEFIRCAAVEGPTTAMDRFGMELAEVEHFLALVTYATSRPNELPAILEHSEKCLLRGDWQPVSPCAMARALHQARSLARCKLIKRLREMLND